MHKDDAPIPDSVDVESKLLVKGETGKTLYCIEWMKFENGFATILNGELTGLSSWLQAVC